MLKKALVIDNNQVFLKLLSQTLQTRGLQVLTASDGISALQILEKYHPDIIFTDLIMPNIDGENLCRIIRNKKEFSSTLLIIVSAITVEENVDFLSFGAHACIAKGPASEIAANIDLILSHAQNGRMDLIIGKHFGAENRIQRSIANELLEAKRHLKLIFDNIDNGILEFSGSETIVNCNSYISELFSKQITDILSVKIQDLFSQNAYQHVSECLDQFKTTHLPVESKHSVKVKSKDIVFKFISMTDNDNSTSIMIIRDISEEKTAHRKLKEYLGHLESLVAERTKSYEDANRKLQKEISEREKINKELEFVARQWSNTFDTITDFVSIHDKNMKFVRVNKALSDFLGKKPEELSGRYCFEIMHGQNAPWQNCPHLAAIEQKKSVTFEINDSKIGVPLLVTCSPLLHDDGSLLGSVHVARDISEQKKSSEVRENLIKKLEDSLAKVKLLSGFIPICASCKKIRDDKGYWKQVEDYIHDHSEAQFSHSLCPECFKKLYPDLDEDTK